MAWRVRLSAKALKALKKLDKQIANRIYHELREIEQLDDPAQRGKALTGNLSGLWRFRVGDYRIVCDLLDGELIVLVIDIGHRRDLYQAQRR